MTHMDTLLTLLLVALGGVALFYIARRSRANYEKENANIPRISRLKHVSIFLLWSIFWAVTVYLSPVFLCLGLLLVFAGVVPIGKEKASLSKSIIDGGFISAITVGLGTLFYVHVI